MFRREDTTWIEETKLTASDMDAGDYFGASVSLDVDVAVVGAYRNSDAGAESGSAYVFHRLGTDWTEAAKLTGSDTAEDDWFGWSVSISGDIVVVGAPGHDHVGLDSGAVYVFRREGNTWVQQSKLTPPDAEPFDTFGYSVSVNSGAVLVGAIGDDDRGSEAGAVYVYQQVNDDCNGNGIGDSCEADRDADGVIDECDPCPLDNPDDSDADGVCDATDACPGFDDGLDADADGVPDDCDICPGADDRVDGDADLIPDDCDLCGDTPTGLLVDIDGCTLQTGPCCFPAGICVDDTSTAPCELFPGGAYYGDGLTCDGDPDGDGVVGCSDGCPLDAGKTHPGVCGCGARDDDADTDGFVDCVDQCLATPIDVIVNACGCPQLGACCSAGGGCFEDVEQAICPALGGSYQGDGSGCADGCNLGDPDMDGDVDLLDIAGLQRCFGGGVAPSAECSFLDTDRCGTIDLSDFAAFEAAMTGPS